MMGGLEWNSFIRYLYDSIEMTRSRHLQIRCSRAEGVREIHAFGVKIPLQNRAAYLSDRPRHAASIVLSPYLRYELPL
jgi:hypothetical protein